MANIEFPVQFLMIGCGNMGGAILNNWVNQGVDLKRINVQDPNPNKWLQGLEKKGLKLNKNIVGKVDVCLFSVKPQIIDNVAKEIRDFLHSGTLVISIVAGKSFSDFENILKSNTPIVRAMPNTPVSIGKGIVAIIGNEQTKETHLKVVESLFVSLGDTVRLSEENDLEIVTAISGSGPAYVFYLIEVLEKASIKAGLSATLSRHLAQATVYGAGSLARESNIDPRILRKNVTSPGGTTEAGLKILMDQNTGMEGLLERTVFAAFNRAVELGKLD